MPIPRLLSPTEVAKLLGVSRNRVYEMCREDQIPHFRLGRHIRFSEAALDEWLAAGGRRPGL